jgi:hypothetical protein
MSPVGSDYPPTGRTRRTIAECCNPVDLKEYFTGPVWLKENFTSAIL